jgi:hypothetical protein
MSRVLPTRTGTISSTARQPRARWTGNCPHPWNESTTTRTWSCAAPPGPASHTSSKLSARPPSMPVTMCPGSASRPSALSCATTGPTTPLAGPSSASCAQVIVIDDLGLLPPWPPRPPNRSTGSSTPPTNDARSHPPATCTPPASTSSCPRLPDAAGQFCWPHSAVPLPPPGRISWPLTGRRRAVCPRSGHHYVRAQRSACPTEGFRKRRAIELL